MYFFGSINRTFILTLQGTFQKRTRRLILYIKAVLIFIDFNRELAVIMGLLEKAVKLQGTLHQLRQTHTFLFLAALSTRLEPRQLVQVVNLNPEDSYIGGLNCCQIPIFEFAISVSSHRRDLNLERNAISVRGDALFVDLRNPPHTQLNLLLLPLQALPRPHKMLIQRLSLSRVLLINAVPPEHILLQPQLIHAVNSLRPHIPHPMHKLHIDPPLHHTIHLHINQLLLLLLLLGIIILTLLFLTAPCALLHNLALPGSHLTNLFRLLLVLFWVVLEVSDGLLLIPLILFETI